MPCKLLITEQTVRESPLGSIIPHHPEIFKQHYDAEYLIMISFVLYELCKGPQSFWHPYFEIVNTSDLPMLWEDEEV